MIQFNLLPDVKMEFIKTRRVKRLVSLVSVITAGTTLVIMLILFGLVSGAQKKHISDLNKDIKSYETKLKNTADLNKILTIQNQLNSLTGLHDQKPVATRLFGYITSLTPAQASISKFDVDFDLHTMTFVGTADSLGTVNKFADTLKFTSYYLTDQTTQVKAFTNVVLSSFSRDDKSTSYQINSVFDPTIFDSKSNVTLSVPKIISTRSETEKPSALFQQK